MKWWILPLINSVFLNFCSTATPWWCTRPCADVAKNGLFWFSMPLLYTFHVCDSISHTGSFLQQFALNIILTKCTCTKPKIYLNVCVKTCMYTYGYSRTQSCKGNSVTLACLSIIRFMTCLVQTELKYVQVETKEACQSNHSTEERKLTQISSRDGR